MDGLAGAAADVKEGVELPTGLLVVVEDGLALMGYFPLRGKAPGID